MNTPLIFGFSISLVGGWIVTTLAFRWLSWLFAEKAKASTGEGAAEEVPPTSSSQASAKSSVKEPWTKEPLVGIIERAFFTLLIGTLGDAGLSSIPAAMLAWIGIKTALHYEKLAADDKPQVVRLAYIGILCSLISFTFVILGGYVWTHHLSFSDVQFAHVSTGPCWVWGLLFYSGGLGLGLSCLASWSLQGVFRGRVSGNRSVDIVTGIIERIFFTMLIGMLGAANLASIPTALLGWIGLKAQIDFKIFTDPDRDKLGSAYVGILCSAASLAFAFWGGYVWIYGCSNCRP